MKTRRVSGYVMKGLFEGEIRYFFYPDNAMESNLVFVPFSVMDFSDFLLEITLNFMYFGYKLGVRNVLLRVLDYEEISYPLFVEGIEVRAIHPLVALEQDELYGHVDFFNELAREAEKEEVWISHLKISMNLMRL